VVRVSGVAVWWLVRWVAARSVMPVVGWGLRKVRREQEQAQRRRRQAALDAAWRRLAQVWGEWVLAPTLTTGGWGLPPHVAGAIDAVRVEADPVLDDLMDALAYKAITDVVQALDESEGTPREDRDEWLRFRVHYGSQYVFQRAREAYLAERRAGDERWTAAREVPKSNWEEAFDALCPRGERRAWRRWWRATGPRRVDPFGDGFVARRAADGDAVAASVSGTRTGASAAPQVVPGKSKSLIRG